MSDDKITDPDQAAAIWARLAMAFGYNELAGRAETFGEKVYLRLMRDHQLEELQRMGVSVVIDEDKRGPTVLTLPARSPHIRFGEKDIEQMRTAVAAFDAAQAKAGPMR